jgi:hypothetical protein
MMDASEGGRKVSPRERVELYEERGGRLVLHRNGSRLAYRLAEVLTGTFATDADRLAVADESPDGSEVLDLSRLPSDRWPDRTAELIATCWEDGRITGVHRSDAEGEAVVEPGWRARRYLAPPEAPASGD